MRCTSPRTVGFMADGKTISWSPRKRSKEYATFQLPCSKCIECRLEFARTWAIRCVHEAQMYPNNCFVTLTYSEENLKSPRLQYKDFQDFMKRLRKKNGNQKLGYNVVGEYGEETKRPHWHAIIFNFAPNDGIKKYKNSRDDQVYSSKMLTETWGHGIAEYGTVTFHSAGYVSRYAAKKLVHGKDDEHDFHPISKKSNKQAIGKKWLETYYQDVFNYGQLVLPDGTTSSIPRYYEKWLKEHKPQEWLNYVTRVKLEKIQKAELRSEEEKRQYFKSIHERGPFAPKQLNASETRAIIQKARFKQLQSHLKLK